MKNARIKTRTRKHLNKEEYYVDVLSYDVQNNCTVETKTFNTSPDADKFVKQVTFLAPLLDIAEEL